jgi:hypothetical protein
LFSAVNIISIFYSLYLSLLIIFFAVVFVVWEILGVPVRPLLTTKGNTHVFFFFTCVYFNSQQCYTIHEKHVHCGFIGPWCFPTLIPPPRKTLPGAKLSSEEHDLQFIIFNHISRLNEKVSLSF